MKYKLRTVDNKIQVFDCYGYTVKNNVLRFYDNPNPMMEQGIKSL